MEIVALIPFVGVVAFGLLFIIAVLKGGSLKLPVIGMGACFVLTAVLGALIFLGIGPFGDGTANGGPTGDSDIGANVGLFDVTLTVPADFLGEGMTQEQLDESAKEGNFKSATLNADGSATYVMSKSQHNELMKEIKQSIDDSLAEMANSENAPNIVKIEANKDYTQYKVTINTEDVGLAESLASLALYLDSGMYHAFNGTQVDNVNIQYINEATGEVIQEANSKDLGEVPSESPAVPNKSEYAIGDTWTVDGQWSLTITGVTETQERNEFSDKTPGAVYIIDYTYTNIGFEESYSDGLFISIDSTIVDSSGKMGTTYPGNVTRNPQETPIGATCDAQTCIGVENPGDFKLTVSKYDGNSVRQTATFSIHVG